MTAFSLNSFNIATHHYFLKFLYVILKRFKEISLSPPITKIVIHCSATKNGKSLRTAIQTTAQRIDEWHKQRGFKRSPVLAKQFNPHLQHLSYHYVSANIPKLH